MSNEIFKMSHEMAGWTPKDFTKTNWRIFRSICWAVQNKGDDVVTIGFDRFRELSSVTEKSEGKLENLIIDTYDKMLSTGFVIDDGVSYMRFNLFRAYKVHREERTIAVAVDKDFLWLLNKVEQYTPIELAEYNSLGSKYSQVMYDLLKRWRTVGEKEWTLEEWREKLDAPTAYTTYQVMQKILAPVMNELANYFTGLNVEKKRRGKGGAIYALRFTWMAEDRNYTKVTPRPDIKTKAEKIADLKAKEAAGTATTEMKNLKKHIEAEKKWMDDNGISDTSAQAADPDPSAGAPLVGQTSLNFVTPENFIVAEVIQASAAKPNKEEVPPEGHWRRSPETGEWEFTTEPRKEIPRPDLFEIMTRAKEEDQSEAEDEAPAESTLAVSLGRRLLDRIFGPKKG